MSENSLSLYNLVLVSLDCPIGHEVYILPYGIRTLVLEDLSIFIIF